MQYIEYLFKIFYYFMFAITIYKFAKFSFKKYKSNNVLENMRNNKRVKISMIFCLVGALIFGFYSMIVSKIPYASDRGYYAMAYGETFLNYQLPKGYLFLTNILSLISDNPNFLFFSIGFIVMFTTLILYRNTKISNPHGLLLLLFSLFFIYDFHLIKQGLAIIIGNISFLYFFEKKYVKSLFWLVIAIFFHESAFLIIPIYLFLIGSKSKIGRFFEYLIIIAIIFLFSDIALNFSNKIYSLFPSFGVELKDYFVNLSFSSAGLQTAMKGIPVYILSFLLIKKRDKFANEVENYDKYMVLSIFVSLTYILSSYMYWMYRFGLYGTFFVYMAFGIIFDKLNKKEKLFYAISVYGLTFFFTIRYLFQMFFTYGGF